MTTSNSDILVFVAMSGGVDSSLAALLLKEQGYNVVGVTLKLWGHDSIGPIRREVVCCSLEMINDARAVCEQIGAPHYVLDFKEEFRREVIANFVDEYRKGRTPYPCAICNRQVKWHSLWQRVSSLGADYLATGHYARIKFDKVSGRYQILKGIDPKRDQSYALWGLSQEDLSHTLFPLGQLTKVETRRLAEKYNLKTAAKPDSQELCFVPDNDMAKFFKEWENGEKSYAAGPIYNLKREKLGEHRGMPFYTVGQRKGFGLAFGKPMYVAKIDAQENAVYIAEEDKLLKKIFTVTSLNWVSIDRPVSSLECQVKIRYQHKPVSATITSSENETFRVEFHSPERAITPGQSAVFYDNEILLGGGIIDQVKD